MLALHGFSGSGLDFELLAEQTPELTWIAPDLPGHGQTGPRPEEDAHGLEAMADVLDRFAATLPRPPVVLGYSMGGRLALHWATRAAAPIERLALVGTTAGIEAEHDRAERRAADEALAQAIIDEGIQRFADRWEATPLIRSQQSIPDPYGKALRHRRRAQDPLGLALSLRWVGTGRMLPLWSRLESLTVPCLVLSGALDDKFTTLAERLEAAIPNVHRETLRNAGHCAHLENWRYFVQVFTNFAFAKHRKMT